MHKSNLKNFPRAQEGELRKALKQFSETVRATERGETVDDLIDAFTNNPAAAILELILKGTGGPKANDAPPPQPAAQDDGDVYRVEFNDESERFEIFKFADKTIKSVMDFHKSRRCDAVRLADILNAEISAPADPEYRKQLIDARELADHAGAKGAVIILNKLIKGAE